MFTTADFARSTACTSAVRRAGLDEVAAGAAVAARAAPIANADRAHAASAAGPAVALANAAITPLPPGAQLPFLLDLHVGPPRPVGQIRGGLEVAGPFL